MSNMGEIVMHYKEETVRTLFLDPVVKIYMIFLNDHQLVSNI